MKVQESHYEFCRKTVQGYDPDGYLLSLFSREPAALWALFAFHGEIAKTRHVVSEPTLGLIRLQWWRDEIEKIYAGEAYAAGEVLQALAVVIAAHDLPQNLFEAMIFAREIEVRSEQPDGVDGALEFLAMVQAPLCELIALIEGGHGDPIEAVALNYGVMDALRRADDKSLVGQNKTAFEGAFAAGVRCESKALRAMQALAEIWMGHLAKGRGGRPPACLALRVWTRGLFM